MGVAARQAADAGLQPAVIVVDEHQVARRVALGKVGCPRRSIPWTPRALRFTRACGHANDMSRAIS